SQEPSLVLGLLPGPLPLPSTERAAARLTRCRSCAILWLDLSAKERPVTTRYNTAALRDLISAALSGD
ncbi:MAG: hypothetical protein WAV70_23165, partial [Anaerolineae bacterium]